MRAGPLEGLPRPRCLLAASLALMLEPLLKQAETLARLQPDPNAVAQLLRVERFEHVIVRAGGQASLTLRCVVGRGEHHDWQVGIVASRAHASAQLESVVHRRRQVDEDKRNSPRSTCARPSAPSTAIATR